jgi:hypothetical protein
MYWSFMTLKRLARVMNGGLAGLGMVVILAATVNAQMTNGVAKLPPKSQARQGVIVEAPPAPPPGFPSNPSFPRGFPSNPSFPLTTPNVAPPPPVCFVVTGQQPSRRVGANGVALPDNRHPQPASNQAQVVCFDRHNKGGRGHRN